jgi:hypothetical protein
VYCTCFVVYLHCIYILLCIYIVMSVFVLVIKGKTHGREARNKGRKQVATRKKMCKAMDQIREKGTRRGGWASLLLLRLRLQVVPTHHRRL